MLQKQIGAIRASVQTLPGLPAERVEELSQAVEAAGELAVELKAALDDATAEAADVEARRGELAGLTDQQLRARLNALTAELRSRGRPLPGGQP